MQIDIESFPIVWMRDHDHGQEHDHDDAEDRTVILALLERGEPFVLIAERMPKLSDLAEMEAKERKARAQLFKVHREKMRQLCAGIILIGRASSLPTAIRMPLEGLASTVGVPLLFGDNEATALHLAQERLRTVGTTGTEGMR